MNRAKLLILLLLVSCRAVAQFNIWEDTDCRRKVALTPYLAEGSGNIAVIVLPGGSYFWHSEVTEGSMVAQWLQSNGISAFVLNYRTAKMPAFLFRYRYIFRGTRYPDAQNDLRRALRVIKSRGSEYGIDTSKIGVMGFSAGGHLALSSAVLFPPQEWPSFIASLYPVVTMEGKYVHKRSRRALLGENRSHNVKMRDSLSIEKHIPAGMPPTFLVNCKDDSVVDYHNSILLDSALCAKSVPHLYLQFNSGGHGFGADDKKGSSESATWKEEFLLWIDKILEESVE